jgi:hypothetical protein
LLLPAVFLFSAGISLFSEAFLVAVTETVDGGPGTLPPPVTEGIFDGLFDSGHIAFNTRDGAALPSTAELLAIARAGGAGYVLEADIAYTRTPIAGGSPRVSATAAFTLIETRQGSTADSGTLSADNRGREKVTDLKKLGFELGRSIVRDITSYLDTGKSP